MRDRPAIPTRDLEDFASTASDWFWEMDADLRFSYFSNLMDDVTGVDRSYMIGLRREEVRPNIDDDPNWTKHLDDLKAHRPFANFEYQMLRPEDGSVLWVRTSGVPIFSEDGTFCGYRGTGHDITDERLAVARLEASNAALAERNRELDDARCALERSALEDALTHVWNRRAFERDAQTLLGSQDREVGILHVDLDRFKWVNDTLGHPTGDMVLQTTAARIRLAVGNVGAVYRVGGDEFMVLLCEQMSQDHATRLAHQITAAMSASMQLGQRSITVGVSIGIAFGCGGTTTTRQLILQADAALYEAKRQGRNNVCAINVTLKQQIEAQRKLAADLPKALENGEFIPYFQPQIDLMTGDVVGVEALARWLHPDLGLLSPDAFLSIATKLALIDEIDREMLRHGLAAVTRLADGGFVLPALSINMSEARLVDPRLATDIGCLWVDRRCDLSFELLESIHFDGASERDQLFRNLQRIRKMGVRIEIDDFGSERASITGLLKIAPDRLKIDRSLVRDVVTSSQERNVMRAILDMARGLGIVCIAEGAETVEAVDVLRDLGCQHAQGFAIAHPMPEDALRAFLASRIDVGSRQRKTAGLNGLPQIFPVVSAEA